MKQGDKVLFLDTVHPLLLNGLREAGYECVEVYTKDLDELEPELANTAGLVIRSRLLVNEKMLRMAPVLRFIARVGSGMENIDLEFAKAKGIHCLNSPEGNRDAVAEHAIALLLGLFNHIPLGDQEVRKGLWNREKNRGLELGGKTLAIIGYGNTGSAFAKRLSGFDVRVLAYDKFKHGFCGDLVEEVEMQQVFELADILSFHVPLSEDTCYLFNSEYISKFKKPIYLINTSRGRVVNTEDMVTALDKGKVLGAALDVLEYEKSSFESLEEGAYPEAFRTLASRDNVILSPHVAGWTKESKVKLASVLLEKILAIEQA